MVNIYLREDFYAYDAFHIIKGFLPNEQIKQYIDAKRNEIISIEINGEKVLKIQEISEYNVEKKENKNEVNKKIYLAMEKYTRKSMAWGILTGIRPTKILMKELEKGIPEEEIKQWFQQRYLVSEKKTELGMKIAKREKSLLEKLDYQNGYSLYIGIPFCPTTCAYCSFTSYPIKAWKNRTEEYLEALCKEISFVGEVSKEKKLNTIYIGGGTPTTLEARQLDKLLTHVEKTFPLKDLKEFTVEAGRPDSITKEKLEVLRQHQITRISINPQTMQQKTLDAIGRKHTIEDVISVYHMARELGFNNINMDLIAGLSGETVVDMQDTLEKIKKLKPDNLTVHSLAIKRASRLNQSELKKELVNQSETLSEMIELAGQYAKEMELIPYYLYRQKNIAGNFENVGYAKVDKAGIYNILIMEEKQSIIAVGAGSSTKIVLPKGKEIQDKKSGQLKNIVRIENVKDVDAYITRIDEMIERKGEWLWR
ncbi:coproporphyrinogen dehydrogenase HemZ [Faecalimonas sp.]